MSALIWPFDLTPFDLTTREGRHRFITCVADVRNLPTAYQEKTPKLFVITEYATIVDPADSTYLVQPPKQYASLPSFEAAFAKDPNLEKYRKEIERCQSAGVPTDWPIILLIYADGCQAEPR